MRRDLVRFLKLNAKIMKIDEKIKVK